MSVVLHEVLDGGVHVAKVNRPGALNALDRAVLDALDVVVAAVRADAGARALVIAGEGGKAFVAGADIAAMAAMAPLDAEAFSAAGQGVFDRIAALPVPVIAAVGGFALGGGCELALACDLVVAGPKATFGQPEVKLGVIPGFGGTQRLVRRVGVGRALDLCLTGRMVKVDEAAAIGLVERVVDGDVLEAALGLAREIAAMGPVAVRLCKRAIYEGKDADLGAALLGERSMFALCFSTADQKEGMAAFLERRAARFTGA